MNLISTVSATFSQIQNSLQQLQADAYGRPLGVLSGSSIGQHVRHVAEFLDCLLTQAQHGRVDYSLRKRDLRLENDLDYAHQYMDELMERLGQVDPTQILILIHEYDPDIEDRIEASSTMARELVYHIEHAIHHMAMIRIGMKEVATRS